MPNESRQELILAAAKARLDAMATPAYWFDYPDAQRLRLDGMDKSEDISIVVYSTGEPKETTNTCHTDAKLMIFVDVWIKSTANPDPDNVSDDTVRTRVCADIERCMLQDTNLGGLVFDMESTGFEQVALEEEGVVVCTCGFPSKYRHAIGDPTAAA